MKFYNYLNEVKDIEDSGVEGRNFETILLKAFELVNMKFTKNVGSGFGYDLHTIGDKWIKLIGDKKVNIKVYGTKWMFSSVELSDLIPWNEKLPEDYDFDKLQKRIKRLFNKWGVPDIVYMKPKNEKIQNKIIELVKDKNIEELENVLVKKNFIIYKLGKTYQVRITHKNNKIGSIAIDKGGKVFIRSEKPRKKGSVETVQFRLTKPKPSNKVNKVKKD